MPSGRFGWSGRATGTEDHARNAAKLRAALELWRGPSLADVKDVSWLNDQARRLDELRLDAVERLVESRLALGEHTELVPELEDLAAQYPFREHVHELLMLALYRSARQADALAAYQRLRGRLTASWESDRARVARSRDGDSPAGSNPRTTVADDISHAGSVGMGCAGSTSAVAARVYRPDR
jgi:DNA-binding SARP family transcriptional activator